MTDNISSFGAAKFNATRNTEDLEPVLALDAAKDWIDKQEQKPDHVIVLVGRTIDGGSGTRFFQAGKYTYHAQIGLCVEAMNMLRDDG